MWHLSWQGTTRGLVHALAATLGKPAKVQAFPDWVLRAIGLLDPVLGAAAEMTYQWKLPYLPDDTRFRTAFGVQPTPAKPWPRRRTGSAKSPGSARAECGQRHRAPFFALVRAGRRLVQARAA